MSLTSSSTAADALDQYNDNLLWDGDSTKASNALEAIRWLLVNRPKLSELNGDSVDFESLLQEKERLEAYVTLTARRSSRARFTRGAFNRV